MIIGDKYGQNPFEQGTLFLFCGQRSRILPNLKQYDGGQVEGFAYLGLGIIIMLVIAIGVMILEKKVMLRWDFIFIIIALTIFAASPVITFGDNVLFEIPCSDKVKHYWEIFRSTGREIWPVYYFIMIYVVVYISRIKGNQYISIAIMVIGTCVQIWDISGRLSSIYDQYKIEAEYQKWNYGIWEQLSERGYEHIVYASPGIDVTKVLNLAEFAIENDMTMSNFYFARDIDLGEYIQKSLEEPNDKNIYVYLDGHAEYAYQYTSLYWYEVDGCCVGVTEPISINNN